MNLIPAKAKKNGSGYNVIIERAGGEPLVLHEKRTKKLPANVVVGLRPEDIGDAQYRKGRDLHVSSCQVDVVEPAGADTFVAGSAIFQQDDYRAVIDKMRAQLATVSS